MAGRSGKVKAPVRASRRSPSAAAAEPAKPTGQALDRLEALAARLRSDCDRLELAAAEAPKVSDFEPLAEHLYSFATSAPRLLEGLQEVPKAAATIQASLASLREVAETLHYSNDRLADSLLKVPRAEDYEPLAAPLREFARVAPALAEALADVLRVARPLAESVAEAPRRGSSASAPAMRALETAAERMAEAREAIVAALGSLPRDPEYARFAAQLRELAVVSPSLLDWLSELPQLTAPLETSVGSLVSAADGLADAREIVLAALRDLGAVSPEG
jgi:ABC-type transporter Mla subunit MlaD